MAVFRGPDDEQGEEHETRTRAVASPGEGVRPGLLVLQMLRRHKGKVLGLIIGLWAGFGIMGLGVLWTLFITACVAAGYFIGKRLDESQEGLLDFLDRVLPPGRG